MLNVLYLYPVLYITGSIVVGIVLEKVLLDKLKRKAELTIRKMDNYDVISFRGITMVCSIIAGLYCAAHSIPLEDEVKGIVDKTVFSLLVISISVLFGRILVGIVRVRSEAIPGLSTSTSIIVNVTRITVMIVGILVVLQTLGISVIPILTAFGVGGIAVALALQESLANLFSGIQLIASRQIRTGDYIRLDSGEEGYVADINWRNTTVRALANNLIVIPNSRMASGLITNYYLPDKEISVLLDVGVSYESDLKKVEEITLLAAREVTRETEGSVKEFEPFIRYKAFAESSINFTVILRVNEFTSEYLIKHEFIKTLHHYYNKHQIEIPFPVRTVVLKNKKVADGVNKEV